MTPEENALLRAAVEAELHPDDDDLNRELVQQSIAVGRLDPYDRDRIIYELARFAARATMAGYARLPEHEHVYDDVTGDPFACPVSGCYFNDPRESTT